MMLGIASIVPGTDGFKGSRSARRLRCCVDVAAQFPRPLQFLRAAIVAVENRRELDKLRELAREQGRDHARYDQIEVLLEHRAAQLDGRAATQLALPLDG
jgi:hypothetical protein